MALAARAVGAVEQRLCLVEIECAEALGEPAVDRQEQFSLALSRQERSVTIGQMRRSFYAKQN
jgi:hypothetical protein